MELFVMNYAADIEYAMQILEFVKSFHCSRREFQLKLFERLPGNSEIIKLYWCIVHLYVLDDVTF